MTIKMAMMMVKDDLWNVLLSETSCFCPSAGVWPRKWSQRPSAVINCVVTCRERRGWRKCSVWECGHIYSQYYLLSICLCRPGCRLQEEKKCGVVFWAPCCRLQNDVITNTSCLCFPLRWRTAVTRPSVCWVTGSPADRPPGFTDWLTDWLRASIVHQPLHPPLHYGTIN